MSQKPEPTPVTAPPHIDFARLLVRICSLQREIKILLAVLAQRPSESRYTATELAEKKKQLAEYQCDLPRSLRNTIEKILDKGRDALGHHLMPTLLLMMHADNPNEDFAERAQKTLLKLRALDTPGTELVFIQPYRDTNGYNQNCDLIHLAVMAKRGFTIETEPEPPFKASNPNLRFRRHMTRPVREHIKPGTEGDEVVFELHLSTDPGDRLPKFFEGLIDCKGDDVTRFHIGSEAVDAFMQSEYMRRHPRSIELLTAFRKQNGAG